MTTIIDGTAGITFTSEILPTNDFNELSDYNGYARNNNGVAATNYPPQFSSTTPMAVHNVRFNHLYGWQLGTQTIGAAPTNANLRMVLRNEVDGAWSNWQEVWHSGKTVQKMGGAADYGWGLNAIDLSDTGGIAASVNGYMSLSNNTYFDGTNWRYKTAGSAALVGVLGNIFNVTTAPAGTPGAIVNLVSTLGVDANGNVVQQNPAGTLGYGTGAGGTVTQATSKSTPVSINKPSGQVIMNASALAAGASVAFNLNNSLITANDVVLITSTTGNNASSYRIEPYGVIAGAVGVRVTNISGGSLSDALTFNFVVIKGAIS